VAAEDAAVTLYNPIELETADQIKVYPNPVTTREFKLGLTNPGPMDEVKIQIVSVAGAMVKDEVISCGGDCSEIFVKLSESIEPGLYSVTVLQGQKRLSTKLVVK
jgi:hypothetical protein